MKTRAFFEIVKDSRSETYEIIGRSTDDLELDVRVCKLIDAGMKVFCETILVDTTTEEDIREGYAGRFKEEPGLYERLQKEYWNKTKTHLF